MSNLQEEQRQSNRGFLIAFIAAFILSFTGILIRMISEDYGLPALIIAFWRDALVFLSAFFYLRLFRPQFLRISRHQIPYLMLFGVVLALFNILWTLAVTLTGAAVATVLVYSSPAFTALLGWLILKETLGWQKVSAVVLCLLGCFLVSGAANATAWQTNPIGIITGISSGLFYAIYSLMGRHATQRGLNPWTTLFYTFGFAAIFLLLINLLPFQFIPGTAAIPSELFALGSQWQGWLLLLFLAAGPSLIGYGLYNVSLGLLPSSTANLILSSEPVVTGISAFFLLGERFSRMELLGSGLILGALLLLRIRRRPSLLR